MEAEWFRDVDAIYIRLKDAEFDRGEELGNRNILFDVDGDVKAIQFLYASEGVDLGGLPADIPMTAIEEWLAQAGVRVLA